MPEISVIVPVYNVEKELNRCLDSILSQTYRDFELLLIDDGSADRSGEICDEYERMDNRISVFHQTNSGVAAARNTGIKNSRGAYLVFIDSDDHVDPEMLRKLYDAVKTADADLAICNYYERSADGSFIERRHRFKDGTVLDRKGIEDDLYKALYRTSATVGLFSMCNKMFKKSIIDHDKILVRESMSYGEDLVFFVTYLHESQRVVFLEDLLYYYEMTQDGLFKSYRRNVIDDLLVNYDVLTELTRTENATDEDRVITDVKYWREINRQLNAIVKNEKHVNRELKSVLSDKTMQKLMTRITAISPQQAEKYSIHPSERKVSELVARNKVTLAAMLVRYQADENYWLRKLRRR